MDFFTLKLFVSAANTRSFTRTGELFFLTQPAVSHQIRKLEEELGVKLFTRGNHCVELTAAGREYFEFANNVLSKEAQVGSRLSDIANGESGQILIASLPSCAYLCKKLTVQLQEEFPSVRAEITILEGPDISTALSRNDYDFYFTGQILLPTGRSDLLYKVISLERFHLFIPEKLMDKIDFSDWSSMNNINLILIHGMDFGMTNRIRKICKDKGLISEKISLCRRADSALLSVEAGNAISILPRGLVDFYKCPDIKIVPIDAPEAEIQNLIIWNKNHRNPASQKFEELILRTEVCS